MPLFLPNPVIHAAITATIPGFGDFEECTGGEKDGVLTDFFPAGRMSPIKVRGTHSYTDLVCSRGFDPARDLIVIDWVNAVLDGTLPDALGMRTVIKTIRNAAGIPITSISYLNCKPRHIKYPDAKAGDSSIAMLVLTLGVQAQS